LDLGDRAYPGGTPKRSLSVVDSIHFLAL